ncbi:hypothetical protein VMCG_04786 [Cytospora schulzeri]|uniref:SnoaL-like domain-containing protein n=1 Tax=Cytospora schulzeri TaxID=448051 RepID=A0A423WNA7_9PEZI|nr:hypothetical protein VMCG_04786 [Valsa malicola]
MTSDADSVILRLLNREPSFLGHDQPSIETGPSPLTLSINGSKYNIISSTVDIRLQHTSSAIQAGRIILAVRKAATGSPSPSTEGVQPIIELAAHIFSGPEDSQAHIPCTTTTIIDTGVLHDSSHSPTRALRASTIPTSPRPDTQTSRQPTLRDKYHAYIATINAGAAAMTSRLAEFCLPVVTHNGQALALPRYQRLMEDAQETIQDLSFHVADLMVDEDKQQVAARLEFTGTPVRPWEDVEPNGKGVAFSEQVFYWFEGGKIRNVVSLVDMEAYRRQMSA